MEKFPKSDVVDQQASEEQKIEEASQALAHERDRLKKSSEKLPAAAIPDPPPTTTTAGASTEDHCEARLEPHISQKAISKLAYTIWEQKGKPNGEAAAIENWQEAEEQLKGPSKPH